MAATVVQETGGGLPEAQTPIERLQIKNILCPVDFSGFSRRALRYAIGLARHFGSGLVIQHTVQPNYLSMAGMEPGAVVIDIESRLQAAREEIRRLLIDMGIGTSEATVLLNDGDVPARILETISMEQIDLLVMGTHAHQGLSRAVLGSVTEDIIHLAVCPVLVVSNPRKDFVDPKQGQRLKTILLTTDFSSHSDRALAYALKWGCEWNAKVVLFHAVQHADSALKGMVDLFPEYNPYFERQLTSAWKIIRHIVPDPVRESCEVSYEVRHGNPKEEILRVAEERGADLIITGARGTGRSGTPWGSVSSAVVRDGRLPVLVVRDRAPSHRGWLSRNHPRA